MPDEKPENQEATLIGGKYKSIDEALADLNETKRQNDSLKESLDREQRLNSLLENIEPAQTPTQTTDDFGDLTTPEGKQRLQSYLASKEQAIYQNVTTMVRNEVSSTENKKVAENKFYTTNKDLGDFKIEVEHFAAEVAREYGPKAKTMPQDTLFGEVAKRTRTYLNEHKKKLTKTPLHLEGGSMSEPNETPPSEIPSASEEDRLGDYMKNEVPAMNKKKTMPLRGAG